MRAGFRGIITLWKTENLMKLMTLFTVFMP